MSATADDWVALAVVTTPHGVSGRVKLKFFSDNFPHYLSQITLSTGEPVKLRLSGEAGGSPVAEIEGLSTRNDAENWRGRELGVPRSTLADISNDDGFYIHDLLGLELRTPEGTVLGVVAEIANYGASDIVVFHDAEGKEHMFAFTEETFPEIHVAQGYMLCVPPQTIGADTREAS